MQVRVCLCEQARSIVPSDCKGGFLRIQNECIIFQALKVQTIAPEVNLMWFEVNMGTAGVSLPKGDCLVRLGLCWKHYNHEGCAEIKLPFCGPALTGQEGWSWLQSWFCKCVSVMWTHEGWKQHKFGGFSLKLKVDDLLFSLTQGLGEFLTLSFSLTFLLDLHKS